MEDIVDAPARGQFQSVSHRVDALDHFEWANIPWVKLSRAYPMEVQVLGGEQHQLPIVELHWAAALVLILLAAILGCLEEYFDLCQGTGLGGKNLLEQGEVSVITEAHFIGQWCARVCTIIQEKGCLPCAAVYCVIYGEFYKGEQQVPALGSVRQVVAQYFLYHLVHPLSLPIRLRVERCGEVQLCALVAPVLLPVLRAELGIPVRDEDFGDTMKLDQVGIKECHNVLSGACGATGYKVCHLGELVYHDKNGIILCALCEWQAGDEIHGDHMPACVRYLEWL
jgi:hypothetical protein